MVRRYRASLTAPLDAAENVCALAGIENPNPKQLAGGALVAHFMLTVIHFFKGE